MRCAIQCRKDWKIIAIWLLLTLSLSGNEKRYNWTLWMPYRYAYRAHTHIHASIEHEDGKQWRRNCAVQLFSCLARDMSDTRQTRYHIHNTLNEIDAKFCAIHFISFFCILSFPFFGHSQKIHTHTGKRTHLCFFFIN